MIAHEYISIIIIPNIPPESRVWVREGDEQSIPVIPSQGQLEESNRFYPYSLKYIWWEYKLLVWGRLTERRSLIDLDYVSENFSTITNDSQFTSQNIFSSNTVHLQRKLWVIRVLIWTSIRIFLVRQNNKAKLKPNMHSVMASYEAWVVTMNKSSSGQPLWNGNKKGRPPNQYGVWEYHSWSLETPHIYNCFILYK